MWVVLDLPTFNDLWYQPFVYRQTVLPVSWLYAIHNYYRPEGREIRPYGVQAHQIPGIN